MTNRQEGGTRRHGKSKQSEPGKPLISVVTATYNAARFLPDTIRSIRAQSYPNIEWIVIDGGSTDATLDLLKANDDIIDYWLSEPDRGIYSAWNKGLGQAKGEWICFLGADDFFLDFQVLDRMAIQLEKVPANIRVVYGQVMLVSVDGETLGPIGEPWQNIKERFYQFMYIPHQGVMHRRSLFEKHGKFDESFRIAGDYELLLRELKTVDAFYVPDIITTAMRQGGLSSDPANALTVMREYMRAQRIHGQYLPRRILLKAMVKEYIRLLLWKVLGERLARKLLDLHRRIRGLPPYWTNT